MEAYCFECRLKRGLPPIRIEGRLLQSDYQRKKYEKHTEVSLSEQLQSVFNDSSTAAIRAEVEAALLTGPVRIDRGRTDFLTESGYGIGVRYERGIATEAQDVTVVVNSSSADRVHTFTESSDRLPSFCDDCGGELFGR